MKKVWLGTTALLGASLLALPTAAQTVTGDGDFDLTLGGEVQFEGHYVSKPDANGRSHWLETEGFLVLEGEGELNNGMEVDFEIEFVFNDDIAFVEFEDDEGNKESFQIRNEEITIDDMWIHLAASWGEVWVGERQQIQNDDATTQRKFLSEDADGGLSIGEGQSPGGNEAQVLGGGPGGGFGADQNLYDVDSFIEYEDDVDLFAYQSNEMSGFTFTINYQPELSSSGEDNGDSTTNNAGDIMNAFILEVEWEGVMGATPMLAIVEYGTAASEDGTAGTLAVSDTRMYLGVLLNDGGAWGLGGFYATYDGEAADDVAERTITGFGIGGNYETGAWEFGGAWETTSTDEAGAAAGSDDYTRWDVGAEFSIDDDRSITVGYRAHTWSDGANLAADEGDAYQYGIQYEWDVSDTLELFAGITQFDYAVAADGTEYGSNVTLEWDLGAGVDFEISWDYQQEDGHKVDTTLEIPF